MKRLLGGAGIVVLLGSSLLFASLNSGQRVTVRLGFATLYGVPLTAVAFGSVIAGMVVMLVAGIRSDLKVRRILRARLQEEDREERERFVDHSQQDLFDSLPPVAASPIRSDVTSTVDPRDTADVPTGLPEPLMTPHRLSDAPSLDLIEGEAPRDPEEGHEDTRSEPDEPSSQDWRGIDASP